MISAPPSTPNTLALMLPMIRNYISKLFEMTFRWKCNYSKLHYLTFRIVDLRSGEDLCFSSKSSNLLSKSPFSFVNLCASSDLTSSASQHSRPSISERLLIGVLLPHSMLFCTIRTLLATLLARGGNCTLRLQFGLRVCQSLFLNKEKPPVRPACLPKQTKLFLV